MAHLFDRSDGAGQRARMEVPEEGLSICRDPDGVLALRAGREPGALAVVVALPESEAGRGGLVVGPGSEPVLVNGQRTLDVAVLEESDEIAVGHERFYFGSRRASEVVTFGEVTARAGQARCVRCNRIFEPVDRVIACPACAALHHEGTAASGEQLSCWTHDALCGACRRRRDEVIWSPETEEEGGDA